MDPETTRENPPVVIAPGIPHEVVDEILDHLSTDSDLSPILLACSLISKSWVAPCRRRLFHTIAFSGKFMNRWLKTFPIPEQSPAHRVRNLSLSLGGWDAAPEEFFRRTQWFTNVEKLSVSALEGLNPVWIPPFGRLPRSVTSLTINTNIATLLEIRDVMEQMPNLNDLALSGCLAMVDRNRVQGIGTALRGEFGGQLRLFRLKRQADADVMNMLLEVPTGLHFAELHVVSVDGCLLSTVRLAEACGKNLVKLFYSVDILDSDQGINQSFDFSKFPNLQETSLGIRWSSGSLLWFSTSLSTLEPSTSPRLSAIRVSISGRYPGPSTLARMREELGNDLRLIEEQAARIEREFMGVASFTYYRQPLFSP